MRKLAVILICLALYPLEAQAQTCPLGITWEGHATIPVYLHPDVAANLVHINGTTWTDDELVKELQNALETLQEQLPTRAPHFEFRGFSSGVAFNQLIPNALHIIPWLDNEPCSNHTTALMGSSPGAGTFITIKRSGSGFHRLADGTLQNLNLPDCHKRFEHWLPTTPPDQHVLRGLLYHELMHNYGIDHYSAQHCEQLTCQASPCGLTHLHDGQTAQGNNPYFWDFSEMVDLYGATSGITSLDKHETSTDGLGWIARAVTNIPALVSLFSTTSNFNNPHMFLAYRAPSTLAPRLHRFTPSSLTWADWGSPDSGPTMGLVGAADDDVGADVGVLAWLDNESKTDVMKELGVARFSGPNTFVKHAFGTNLVRYQGIALGYDQRNDVEVMAWRNGNGEVTLQTYNNGTFSNVFTLAGQFAGDSPTVACGPSTLPFNCVVTWASVSTTGPSYRVLRWMHFRTSSVGGVISIAAGDVSSVMENGYFQYGSPSVGYLGLPGCPYIFAWKNPGLSYYTRCKGTGPTDGLTPGTEVIHTRSKTVNSPSVGSTSAGSYELLDMMMN